MDEIESQVPDMSLESPESSFDNNAWERGRLDLAIEGDTMRIKEHLSEVVRLRQQIQVHEIELYLLNKATEPPIDNTSNSRVTVIIEGGKKVKDDIDPNLIARHEGELDTIDDRFMELQSEIERLEQMRDDENDEDEIDTINKLLMVPQAEIGGLMQRRAELKAWFGREVIGRCGGSLDVEADEF